MSLCGSQNVPPYKKLKQKGKNKMTNFEAIRAMTVEELAEYIFDMGNGREYCYGHCAYQDMDRNDCPNDGGKGCLGGIIKWLESEAEK